MNIKNRFIGLNLCCNRIMAYFHVVSAHSITELFRDLKIDQTFKMTVDRCSLRHANLLVEYVNKLFLLFTQNLAVIYISNCNQLFVVTTAMNNKMYVTVHYIA